MNFYNNRAKKAINQEYVGNILVGISGHWAAARVGTLCHRGHRLFDATLRLWVVRLHNLQIPERVEASIVPVLEVVEQAMAEEVPGKSLRRQRFASHQIPMH